MGLASGVKSRGPAGARVANMLSAESARVKCDRRVARNTFIYKYLQIQLDNTDIWGLIYATEILYWVAAIADGPM